MRIRITVKPTGSRADDLRIATEVRQCLWQHAPMEVVPGQPFQGIHRDEKERPHFIFATTNREEMLQVLDKYGYADRVELTDANEILGEACENCGNIAGPILPAVCPNCHFQEISACPVCDRLIPPKSYIKVRGRLFKCPECRSRVRMRYNDPQFLPDGHFNQPVIVLEVAEPVEQRR
jgi:hypothetical protein